MNNAHSTPFLLIPRSLRHAGRAALASLGLGLAGLQAEVIFSENFDGLFGGNFNNNQPGSNARPVGFGANLPGWTKSGGNAIHGVDNGGGNLSVMIFSHNNSVDTNTLRRSLGTEANTLGMTYTVSFDVSAATYGELTQATQAGDQLRIQILTILNSALFTYDVSPGAWTGNMAFSPTGFSYVGDGSGAVDIYITSATYTGRFSGAIDNLVVTSGVVPEPATAAAWCGALALVVVAFVRRRRSS